METPFEAICHHWTKDPSIFKIDPRHLIPGPNTLGFPSRCSEWTRRPVASPPMRMAAPILQGSTAYKVVTRSAFLRPDPLGTVVVCPSAAGKPRPNHHSLPPCS